jgi:peptide/nickel transport system permease protein
VSSPSGPRLAVGRPRGARQRRLPLDGFGLVGAALLGAIVLLCAAAPLLTPYDPAQVDLTAQLQPPGPAHPLGTDHFGRDLLARLLHGGRLSLAVAAGTTLLVLALSLVVGAVAGYIGGHVDEAAMRLADVTLAFPRLVLALAIAGLLGAGAGSVVVAIVAVSWAWYARIVRGLVLAAREEPYVLAARALGARPSRLLARHVLPAIAGPVAVLVSLDFGQVILGISALSFLGLGPQPPEPEWGAMLNEGRLFFAQAPELMVYPGLAIALTVLGCTLLGDALHDALDPRRR